MNCEINVLKIFSPIFIFCDSYVLWRLRLENFMFRMLKFAQLQYIN